MTLSRRGFILTNAGALVGVAMGNWACESAQESGVSQADTTAADMTAADFTAERRFVETAYGRIAYVERGAGPAALFLHGFPLNGFHWRGVIPRLSGLRRCIALDLLGMGYTEVPEQQDVSPQAQTDMLAAFLDALSIPAVDLVANDSGTTIAQLFMVQHPDRVRTVLLTDGDVHENNPPAGMSNSIAQGRDGLYDQKIERHLDDPEYARSEGFGASTYMDPATFSDEAIEYYFTPLLASPLQRTQMNRHVAAFEPNVLVAIEPALRRSTTPTRMVWGTADHLFPVELAEWLDQTLPESRGVRLVEGGGSCSGRRRSPICSRRRRGRSGTSSEAGVKGASGCSPVSARRLCDIHYADVTCRRRCTWPGRRKSRGGRRAEGAPRPAGRGAPRVFQGSTCSPSQRSEGIEKSLESA